MTSGPPADRVVPAMENAEGLGVKIWSAMVYALLGLYGRVGRLIIELPIASNPDGPRLMIVLSIVVAGPPAEMVVLIIGNAEGLGVKVWSAMV